MSEPTVGVAVVAILSGAALGALPLGAMEVAAACTIALGAFGLIMLLRSWVTERRMRPNVHPKYCPIPYALMPDGRRYYGAGRYGPMPTAPRRALTTDAMGRPMWRDLP